jgi:RNA polymerase II subunit A small phosphatase-like protein
MPDEPRKLLILDLDETLIYACEQPLERFADFRVGPYHVYRRPFLHEFLAFCLEWFEVAVWTVGTANYADGIVAAIFPPKTKPAFVWSRERCTYSFDGESREYYWRKNMKKVRRRGYDLSQVIAIDNTPKKWRQSYGNLVAPASFYGNPDDAELPALRGYLEKLKDAPNIRAIEKRGWRNHSRLVLAG